MRSLILTLCLVLAETAACKSSNEAQPISDDANVEDDAAEVIPPLDPSKCPVPSGTDDVPFDPSFVPKSSGDVLVDRDFPLLAALSVDPYATAIAHDAASTAIANARRDALASCTDCVAAVKWTDADAKAAASAMAAAIDLGAIAKDMRASGAFALHASLDDATLFATAFTEEVTAAAAAVASYDGELDAAKHAAALTTAREKSGLPFDPTLAYAIATMRGAGRDEAVRHLDENAETLAAISHIDFKAYPFPILLVPGQGPTSLDEPVSDASIARANLAADRWFAKLAPLIVLSGGHVHPDRTPYSEAIEMKQYLRDIRHVPSNALLVDAWARHTTTNLRDVARLMLHAKIPVDRPSLIVTDIFQSLYIIGNPFAVRCDTELHLRPFRGTLQYLSTTDTCFFASKLALQVDPSDPLDP